VTQQRFQSAVRSPHGYHAQRRHCFAAACLLDEREYAAMRARPPESAAVPSMAEADAPAGADAAAAAVPTAAADTAGVDFHTAVKAEAADADADNPFANLEALAAATVASQEADALLASSQEVLQLSLHEVEAGLMRPGRRVMLQAEVQACESIRARAAAALPAAQVRHRRPNANPRM
jgi:hypothetical protein